MFIVFDFSYWPKEMLMAQEKKKSERDRENIDL